MTATELRCGGGVLFGILKDGVLEVKCRDTHRCGVRRPGVVIIHRFSAFTGDLLENKEYRDPEITKGR